MTSAKTTVVARRAIIDWFEDIDDADVVEGVGDFELDDLIGRP